MDRKESFMEDHSSNHKWIKDKLSGEEYMCPMDAISEDGSVDFSMCVSDSFAGVNPRGG